MATAADQLTSFVRDSLARDVARNPASRLTPVYRFLAYLAVLVMALVMLGDLVYVVFSLLQGDATPRFLLKAFARLEDLRADPRTFVRDIDDPVTGTPYGYRPTGPRTYELTATFDLESPPREPPNGSTGGRDGFFTHGPGPRTFTVPEKPKP